MIPNTNIDDIEPGEVVVAEPLDDVELEYHGLADESASPLLIQATVEREGGDSILTYEIVGISGDESSYIVEPQNCRNKRAEEAIEKAGGTVKVPARA